MFFFPGVGWFLSIKKKVTETNPSIHSYCPNSSLVCGAEFTKKGSVLELDQAAQYPASGWSRAQGDEQHLRRGMLPDFYREGSSSLHPGHSGWSGFPGRISRIPKESCRRCCRHCQRVLVTNSCSKRDFRFPGSNSSFLCCGDRNFGEESKKMAWIVLTIRISVPHAEATLFSTRFFLTSASLGQIWLSGPGTHDLIPGSTQPARRDTTCHSAMSAGCLSVCPIICPWQDPLPPSPKRDFWAAGVILSICAFEKKIQDFFFFQNFVHPKFFWWSKAQHNATKHFWFFLTSRWEQLFTLLIVSWERDTERDISSLEAKVSSLNLPSTTTSLGSRSHWRQMWSSRGYPRYVLQRGRFKLCGAHTLCCVLVGKRNTHARERERQTDRQRERERLCMCTHWPHSHLANQILQLSVLENWI